MMEVTSSTDPPPSQEVGFLARIHLGEEADFRDLEAVTPSLRYKISAFKSVDECEFVCEHLFGLKKRDDIDRFRREMDDARGGGGGGGGNLPVTRDLILHRIADYINAFKTSNVRLMWLEHFSAMLDLMHVVLDVEAPDWHKFGLEDPDPFVPLDDDFRRRFERCLFPVFRPNRYLVEVAVVKDVAFVRVAIGEDLDSVNPTYLKYCQGQSVFLCDKEKPDELILKALCMCLNASKTFPVSIDPEHHGGEAYAVVAEEESEVPPLPQTSSTMFTAICESCNWSVSGSSSEATSTEIMSHDCNNVTATVAEFVCEHCDKSFLNARGLKLHQVRIHNDNYKECPDCPYRSINQSSLDRHVLLKHGTPKEKKALMEQELREIEERRTKRIMRSEVLLQGKKESMAKKVKAKEREGMEWSEVMLQEKKEIMARKSKRMRTKKMKERMSRKVERAKEKKERSDTLLQGKGRMEDSKRKEPEASRDEKRQKGGPKMIEPETMKVFVESARQQRKQTQLLFEKVTRLQSLKRRRVNIINEQRLQSLEPIDGIMKQKREEEVQRKIVKKTNLEEKRSESHKKEMKKESPPLPRMTRKAAASARDNMSASMLYEKLEEEDEALGPSERELLPYV